MALVLDVMAARFVALPAGVPPAPGAAVDVQLEPGAYELRIVGGDVAVNQGLPIGAADFRVVEDVPAQVLLRGNVRAAAVGAAAATLWITPLREVPG
jgi:hypothetical protein